MVRGTDVGQSAAQAAEARRILRPLAGQQPTGLVLRARVDGGEVEPDPRRDGGRPQLRQVAQVAPGPAFEGDGGPGPPGGDGPVAAFLAVGVAVVVEEQVQPGRGAQVEQRERGRRRVAGGHVAEGRQQRGATTDLVGLGGPGREEPLELAAVQATEVGEVGRHV